VALPKIVGIETEYGIVHRGTDEPNPITASSLLINAFVSDLVDVGSPGDPLPRVGWDFEDESPGADARGMVPAGSLAPDIETHLVNAVLTNGARYYVDHAHPELSTPECADALTAVLYDRAGELILERSMTAASRLLPEGQELVVYKNNSDGKGNSYGCHENYLMDRATPFGRIVSYITPHFVSRQIFTGSGKVGSELPGESDGPHYQLTQRADFFEEEVGLETTLKRPIVNTRDEPHADAQKYRRLHVIVGDANMSEVATYLKVGTTALILCMIEDDFFDRELTLAYPVPALQQVSRDLSLRQPLELTDGTTMTALEMQWEFYDRARKYAELHGLGLIGEPEGHEMLLERWEAVLTGLETDPMTLNSQVDWVAKYRLLEGYRERHGLNWDDMRIAAMALQYHDLRSDRSLTRRIGLEQLVGSQAIENAVTEPPDDTRAYFRGKCLQRWSNEIVAANWDSLVFDIGDDPLRRVPMMEPTRGTREHVGPLLDAAGSAADLLDRLQA
jgi:proteasome accessory factor A